MSAEQSVAECGLFADVVGWRGAKAHANSIASRLLLLCACCCYSLVVIANFSLQFNKFVALAVVFVVLMIFGFLFSLLIVTQIYKMRFSILFHQSI